MCLLENKGGFSEEITNEMLENTISNISSDLSQTIKAVKNEIKIHRYGNVSPFLILCTF